MTTLTEAAKLYLKTYADTQTHPTASQEAHIIMAMRDALDRRTTMPPELEELYKLHKNMEIDGLKRQCNELWDKLEKLHLWLRRTIGDDFPANNHGAVARAVVGEDG